ncbi:ABC transporter substrate-binding protein [Azospirillum rugosum]|uniref:Spermidine/putrescine transport system substrate-binding protein n=1 Tax=Azospirillum rugosum TaxID=416170 RepID=A0ABS4SVA8_9PROT|nr:extracellular solute-binding protein [Azospirillum rugosum]MBP2296505.1 putative spermidine/putrescine transport system substrate-binding protein [Azospirillum rugosum]MDQ0530095.1 putative spermidine/putrescine transport system substrate-binding protein [Azospirillum rugosum]
MNETTGKQGQSGNKGNHGVSRRAVLAGAGTVAAVAAIGFPNIVRAQSKTLKVGVYGGYFKESFEKHIFPDFSKASGITVEPVAEPTGEAWLVQLEQAARARQAPADVSMMSQVAMLKGMSAELWAPFDMAKLPNAAKVMPHLINKYPDGKVSGVGAVSWYITLVTNTKAYPQAPESWAALWDPANKDKLGLLALVSNSFLLEVTAATFFGGTKHLDTEQGQLDCFKKLAELKNNVKLWYRDEAQFEAALKSGEIPMGQYYHDVTGLAAADGNPVRSTFPKEGGINDSGSWAVSRASKAGDLAHVFVDYMCQPQVQALLSRKVGTAPTIDRKLTDLTDKEFAAVSSDIPPIIPRYDLYQAKSDWLNQKWTEMIVG